MAKSEQWVSAQTAEVQESDAVWVTPSAGLKVEGTLIRAFLVKQSDGKLTAGYAVEQEDESVINVGERFFFKDNIRGINLGSRISIEFTEEKPLKKSKSQWLGHFKYINGKGPNVMKTLREDYDKRYSEEASDAPF